jgi:hypothetical protein
MDHGAPNPMTAARVALAALPDLLILDSGVGYAIRMDKVGRSVGDGKIRRRPN